MVELFLFSRDIVKNSWDHAKSARKNLTDMGLSYDSNVTVSRAIKRPGHETVSHCVEDRIARSPT